MSDELNTEQQRSLLSLARQAIKHHLETHAHLRPETKDKALREKRGVFVTLKIAGQLRGCIGYPTPVKPLDEAVVDMAIAASSQDYRFSPLRPDELDAVRIEISVLSVPKRVRGPADVEVGRHGIIISKGLSRGLLLPQVPTEYGWDRETFLRHGCLKAGLDESEWKKGITIETFTAQVFGEE